MQFSRLQLNNLRKYIEIFKKFSKSERYKQGISEREKRKKFYQSFTASKIKKMDEYEFTQFIGKLWASEMFTNKEYRVRMIIASNGFDKLKKELVNLLYAKKEPERRYEDFLKRIKYLGPSSITEILCYVYPQRCGIWNDRARKALKILGFNNLPLNKYKISAKEYKRFNEVIFKISQELRKAGFKNVDLLFTDYFLYNIWRFSKEKESFEKIKKVEKEVLSFDHEEIKEKIYQIGLWLGFEAETEKAISKGARVDVIWRAKIGNLGLVNYVFEVQKRGSIDSLILNLQKAKKNPTVQKLVVVSNKEQIEKLKEEVEDLDESFKRALTYWEVEKVQKVHDNLSEIIEIIDDLGLIQKEF